MTGFLHILPSKPLKMFYPKLLGTLMGFVGLKWGQLGKGNFGVLLETLLGCFADVLHTLGNFCGGLGRVSVGTTVNKRDKLSKYTRQTHLKSQLL